MEKSSGATQLVAKNIAKKYRNLVRKKPYKRPPAGVVERKTKNDDISDGEDTLNTFDTIAELQPGKNAQIAAKNISEKYKKMREAKRRKNIFRLSGQIVPSAPVVTAQGDVVIPAPVASQKVSVRRAADKIRQENKNVRKNKALKLLKLRGNERVLNDDTERKETVFTKSACIAAK